MNVNMVDPMNKMHHTTLVGQKSMLFILILSCMGTIVIFFSLDRLQSPIFYASKPVPRIRNYDKRLKNEEYDHNVVELQRRLNKATDKKIILIWYPPFGAKQANNIDAANCGNCQATYDIAMISDPSTAAVVFHFNEITKSTMPSQSSRNFDQLHIFWSMESPPSLRILRGRTLQFENEYQFNATMSYRLDSDILSTYGLPTSKETYYIEKLHSNLENILNFKSKIALAVVSNCGATVATARRLQIIKEVVNLGFDLDVHGACFPGKSPFPRGEEGQEAKRKYKFYFSFENSYHCKNYITEKFFSSALDVSAVPVVRGATKEDYEAIAPPGSFIHYDDFSSTKELVKYLNYLDKNNTAYLEYFEWYKLKPEKLSFYKSANGLCQICRVVHGINLDDIFKSNYYPSKKERPLFTNGTARRTVSSISEWFYGDNEPECLTQR